MKVLLVLLAAIAVIGCAEAPSQKVEARSLSLGSAAAESNSSNLLQTYKLRALKTRGAASYIASSETVGFVVFDANGKILQKGSSGDVKSIDVYQSSTRDSVWVAAVDEAENNLQIARFNTAGTGIDTVALPQAWTETLIGVCLASWGSTPESAAGNEVFAAWIISEEGSAYQMLLQTNGTGLAGKLIRRVALGEGVSACATSDDRFIWHQQGVGVLSLNASPEKPEERRLELPQKGGNLGEDVTDLQILQGTNDLLIVSDSSIGLYRSNGNGGGAQLVASVPADLLPENLSSAVLLQSGKDLELFGVTDEGNNLWQLDWQNSGYTTSSEVTQSSAASQLDSRKSHLDFDVYPAAETDIVKSYGDAADDPEIWVNPKDPQSSLILGTDKKQGLWVYDLSGRAKQFLGRGDLNNVDVRQGVVVDNELLDFAIATNRTTLDLDLFEIDRSSGKVVHMNGAIMDKSLGEPYGGCAALVNGKLQAFVNNKEGLYQQWQIEVQKTGSSSSQINSAKVREFTIGGQPEGCVVDDRTSTLYFGQEDYGVWKLHLDSIASQPVLMDSIAGGNLVADVEGISLYQTEVADVESGKAGGYLVVSSQGDDAYVLYDLLTDEFAGRFQVVANPEAGVDGASETDGLAVTSANLGGTYDRGMLVVQDGRNRMPKERQNFKIVPWQSIESHIQRAPIFVNTGR